MDSGGWYIVHAVANNENRVATELRVQFEKNNLGHLLHEVVVPKKTSIGVRRGVKVEVEDRVLPGYVLVRMDCTLEGLYIIRSHPRVIGVLGADSKGVPSPLGEEEVRRLLDRVETIDQASRQDLRFEPGEHVKVSEGLFSSMEGVVEEIDAVKGRLKISISIFGRPTPVDLEFTQVEKI